MTRTQRIAPQTYRIGDYVAFQNDKLRWTLGKPISWDDPLGGGLVEGTVTSHHTTLRDCKQTVSLRKRARNSIRLTGYKNA